MKYEDIIYNSNLPALKLNISYPQKKIKFIQEDISIPV